MSLRALLLIVASCLVTWLGCSKEDPAVSSASTDGIGPIFSERATALGIEFQHESGATGRLFMPETTGSGVALFDYDNDGDLDIYLVQGGSITGENQARDQLFRNDLAEHSTWKFVDVTDSSGITATEYGQGIAVADVNNDGFDDIFLANFGQDQLWINSGDGRYRLSTGPGAPDDSGWAASAVFFDYDSDGAQDLFVTRYLRYSIASHKDCFFATGAPDYCKPGSYTPVTDLLYRNVGQGRFQKITGTDIDRIRGNGLGVVAADLNEDGRLDLYVANDQMPNVLWINRGDGLFEDQALLAGVALNSFGMAEASMGVVAADFDTDGKQDLFMTHIDGETNTLFRNLGDGLFEDQTRRFGLAAPSVPRTSFGVAAIDYDLDGLLDLAIVNGAVHIDLDQLQEGSALPLAQADQLLHGQGDAYVDVSPMGGARFIEPAVGRGLASGDLDNDGDPDLVVNNAHGAAKLFVAEAPAASNWIGFKVEGQMSRAAEEGVRVEIELGPDNRRVGWVQRGGSYLSAGDSRVMFGLGDHPQILSVTVTWPGGTKRRWGRLVGRRYYTLEHP